MKPHKGFGRRTSRLQKIWCMIGAVLLMIGSTAMAGAAALPDEETLYQRALLYEGDNRRLAEVMRRAAAGQEITVGVIGGSVTAGAGATDMNKTSWGPLYADWWRETFPDTTVNFINAGIGATGSIFGACRVQDDLLQHKPDVVVVEYSVNDMNTDHVDESYEGLLRQILNSEKKPAVMAMAIMNNQGENVQDIHLKICQNYQIPYLSYRDAYYPEVQAGTIAWTELSADEVHPTDRGHSYIAGLLTRYLDEVYKEYQTIAAPEYALPAPVTRNGFEDGRVYNHQSIRPASLGSFRDYSAPFWGDGFRATAKGEPIVFEVCANYVYLNYKRSVTGGGNAYVKVDGGKEIRLTANFQGGWGDYMATELLLREADAVPQTHRIEIHFDDARAGREFVISSLLIANKGAAFNPSTGPTSGSTTQTATGTTASATQPTTGSQTTRPAGTTTTGRLPVVPGTTTQATDTTDGSIADQTQSEPTDPPSRPSGTSRVVEKVIKQIDPVDGTVSTLLLIACILGCLTLACIGMGVWMLITIRRQNTAGKHTGLKS